MLRNERIPSTGEPPTVQDTSHDSGTLFSSGVTSHLVTPQEADSGYEASPSSTNGVCTFLFDEEEQDQSNANPPGAEASTAQTEHCPSTYQTDSEDEEESCPISSHQLRCESFVHFARDASNLSHSSRSRLSSAPIEIPSTEISGRRRVPRSLPPTLSMDVICSRSPRMIPSSLVPLNFVLRMPNRSWPSTLYPNLNRIPALRNRQRSQGNHNVFQNSPPSTSQSSWSRTNRRRLIDSEASSNSSSASSSFSDCDYDSVFPAASSAPLGTGRLALPDVVPCNHNTIVSNGVRRSRSISINLPLDREQTEVAMEIGRALRRLSDQFENSMMMRQRRGSDHENRRRAYSAVGDLLSTLNRFDRQRPNEDHTGHDASNQFDGIPTPKS